MNKLRWNIRFWNDVPHLMLIMATHRSFGENLKVWFHFFFIFFLLLFFTLTTEKHIKFKGLFLAFKIQRFFSPQITSIFILPKHRKFCCFPSFADKTLKFLPVKLQSVVFFSHAKINSCSWLVKKVWVFFPC